MALATSTRRDDDTMAPTPPGGKKASWLGPPGAAANAARRERRSEISDPCSGSEIKLERILRAARMASLSAAFLMAATAFTPAATQGVRSSDAEMAAIAAGIRGILRAVDQATVSTEVALLLVELPFREGQKFKRGDLLARFDCRRQAAEAQVATAAHREALLNLSSNVKLDRFNAVGKNDLEITKVREERARAELEALRPRLDECTLIAPFDGRILDIGVRVHERTTPQ